MTKNLGKTLQGMAGPSLRSKQLLLAMAVGTPLLLAYSAYLWTAASGDAVAEEPAAIAQPPRPIDAREQERLAVWSHTSVSIDVARVAPSIPPTPPEPAETQGPAALMMGTIIHAAMITPIRSDLPGSAIAQVTLPVKDTRTGRRTLIPAGAKLIGERYGKTINGLPRVLVVWRRIQFGDGSTLELPPLRAVDAAGVPCRSLEVGGHCWPGLGEHPMTTIISPRDVAGGKRTRGGRASQPPLLVQPGHRFQFLLGQDLALSPYESSP